MRPQNLHDGVLIVEEGSDVRVRADARWNLGNALTDIPTRIVFREGLRAWRPGKFFSLEAGVWGVVPIREIHVGDDGRVW